MTPSRSAPPRRPHPTSAGGVGAWVGLLVRNVSPAARRARNTSSVGTPQWPRARRNCGQAESQRPWSEAMRNACLPLRARFLPSGGESHGFRRTEGSSAGPVVSGVSQTLQVTGTVPTQPPGGVIPVATEVVPTAASSVAFNVTVISPATRPGTPATFNP
jgi:hypothetical protein